MLSIKTFTDILVKCVRIILHISNVIVLNIAIVLSVLLRYTDSDYPVGIFKLFPQHMSMKKNGTNSSKRSDIYKCIIFHLSAIALKHLTSLPSTQLFATENQKTD